MKRLAVFSLFILLISVGCSKKLTAPSFIKFKVERDSLYVISKNTLPSPLVIKATNKVSNAEFSNQLEANTENVLLKFEAEKMDSTAVLKRFKFSGYYGRYPNTGYDTTHIYMLPFQKGYESKIIQGYDGIFSHKGDFSSKCIDFDMKIGDTITAARDGVVVKMSQDNYKQGTTDDYKEFGNYIMLYHKDNTFSQYVHLKQYGGLVKVGDSVKANQPIALSGFTGWTTTPHLHFGVYQPTEKGLVSIPILFNQIPAEQLKRGDIITKILK